MKRSLSSLVLIAGLAVASGGQAQSTLRPGGFTVQRVLQIAPQLRTGSYLGVMLVDINADRAKALKLAEERGVEVTNVEPDSPAESAGLRPGDVLLSYNGENILGAEQFVRLVEETPAGRKVRVQFWRDGKLQNASITTAPARPRGFGLPPGIVGFTVPDMRSLSMPDIPNPMLVWKNSLFGMECEPLGAQLAQYFGVKRGVLVRSIEKGAAAEKAGLKAGDVITGIGDRAVSSPRDMTSYVRSGHQTGKSIPLTLMRDHKELTFNIVPEEPPQ